VPDLNFRQVAGLEWVVKNALHNSINVGMYDYAPVTTEGGSIGSGLSQRYSQNWIVVYTARNVADNGVSALLDSGAVAVQILQALQGHWLSDEHIKELTAQPNKLPVIDLNGFVHTSFIFSTEVVIDGLCE
jgi:hypothetical protein